MKNLKNKIGIIFVILILSILWGPFLMGIILSILYFVFPNQWIDPIANIFFVIFPGAGISRPCENDYMGGCI